MNVIKTALVLSLLLAISGCASYSNVYSLNVGTDQFDMQHPEQSKLGIRLTCEWKSQ